MGMGRYLLRKLNDALATGAYVAGGRRPKRGLVVLRYDDVEPSVFTAQLRAVGLTPRTRIVGLRDAAAWLDDPPPSGTHVLFTFDGGLNAQLYAATELAKYGLSAAFFVPVSRLGEAHLDDDGIRLLVQINHDVQPMLSGHLDLATLTPEEVCEELGHALDFCSRFAEPFAIAYANSDQPSERVAKVVARRGMRMGFSAEAGRNSARATRKHPLRLRRITVSPRDRPIVIQAKAAGHAGPVGFLTRTFRSLRGR